MKSLSVLGIILIVAGVLGLAYGGFNYTKKTHTAKIGSMSMSIDDREHVNIPTWAGAGLLISGVLLLVFTKKR